MTLITDEMVEKACKAIIEKRGGKWPNEFDDDDVARARENMRTALVAALDATTPRAEPQLGLVPTNCTGVAFSFEGGSLYVRKDGSGYIVVDQGDFALEDDRCEGPDGPEGSVHWIARFPADEMVDLRNFLNGDRFSPSETKDVPAGLSPWCGWDNSNYPWSGTKHQDEVCSAVFRAPWSMEDAATLIGFIDRTWPKEEPASKEAANGL